jgi:hypothetical protein
MEILNKSDGGVLELRYKNFLKDSDSEDPTYEEKNIAILVWARIIKEKYGQTDSATIMIFSPIIKEDVPKYTSKIY